MSAVSPRTPRSPSRRFEAIVFDWDGTAVPDRQADAGALRALVDELSAFGLDLAVITGTRVGNVDGQLGARPPGPGSLLPNLDFYEPRTAHGSSLSPAIHASLLARAGRYRPALEALRIAARMDLDDLTGSTAGGLHLATMGGLWQALAFGFAGLRPRGDRLVVDPRLPPEWNALELGLRFRGEPFRLRIERGGVTIDSDALSVQRGNSHWEVAPR
jgi:hypothetical protein